MRRQPTGPERPDAAGTAAERMDAGCAAIARTCDVRPSLGTIAIPVITLLIASFGALMVYSASYYTAETQYGDAFYFMKKQVIGFILGILAMLGAGFFPYKRLLKLKWPALAVSLILLVLVFIPGLGVENYGATRWIGIGPITIQPSEIAKYGFVIFAAAYACEKPEKLKTFIGMLPIVGAGAAICVLIILEPNMSVTMCVKRLDQLIALSLRRLPRIEKGMQPLQSVRFHDDEHGHGGDHRKEDNEKMPDLYPAQKQHRDH